MFDRRNNLSLLVEEMHGKIWGISCKSIIPRNVRVSEAPSYSLPVLSYDPTSKGAQAYRDLAKEFLANNPTVTAA